MDEEGAQSWRNWDLESDEIASVTSEDLHANRPNRWTGPQSSWRTLTTEERLLWRSMQQLHNRDLALHLYDGFALKRAGRGADTARALTVKTEGGRDVVWAPPKGWTAWPMSEKQVPREALIRRDDDDDDDDERFTVRRAEPRLPRSELHEELGATILRLAKERFRKRKRSLSAQTSAAASAVAETDVDDDAASLPSSPPVPAHAASGDEDGDLQTEGDEDGGSEDEDHAQPAKRAKRTAPATTYEPVVSANDELSYELLDPCVGHILAQLDRTLTVLHNTRVAGVSHLSDSSTDSDSDSQTPRSRSRRRPRRTWQPGDDESALSSAAGSGGSRRRGRPRKVRLPREGETDDEFRVRVARETHRRIPWTQSDRDAAFEAWLRGGDAGGPAQAREEAAATASEGETSGPQDETATEGEDAGGGNAEAKLRRWGLRDWSDVVGAAALAGFSEDVVKRTARRCSRLLGEGMLIRRLDERPASRAADGPTAEFEYRPERIRPFAGSGSSSSSADGTDGDGDDDDEDAARRTLPQRRLASLASTPSPRGRRCRGASASSASASRSRSRSSAGLAYCPVASCERAASGFTRRHNLRRHLLLVHPGRAADAAADADSDDDVLGAVHVDGFLRPIAVARGWRADVDARRARGRPREHDAAGPAPDATDGQSG